MLGESKITADLEQLLEQSGLRRADKENPSLISWGEESKLHPRQWPMVRRIFDTSVILFIQFFSTSMSTAGTSLGSGAEKEYGLTRTTSILAFVFTYQMGVMTGAIILPPFTESFGRKQTYVFSCVVYSIMCLIIGVTPNVAGAIVGRFLAGFVGSAGSSVAAGSMEEMYTTTARVWVISAWATASTSGLAIGPIYGSYIAETIGWRWGFYIAAMITLGTAGACLLIRESRPARVLESELRRISGATDRHDLYCDNGNQLRNIKDILSTKVVRPLHLFFTEPIVATVVSIAAIAWSLVFLFTEALTIVFELDGFAMTETSLFFIPILIGALLSVPVRIWDWQNLHRKSRLNQALKPEDKLFGFYFAAPILAIGLWWFAWTTPHAVHTHWIVPSLALVLIGFAVNEIQYVLTGYLADSYTAYASSAVGALSSIRAGVAGTLPLFAYFMFTGISTNAASSILAGVATAFCIVPFLFLKYGERLRNNSRFAKYSVGGVE